MWRLVEPCLKGSRLMGTRMAQFDLNDTSEEVKSSMKNSTNSFRGLKSSIQIEEIDAFYARMLKK